MDIVTILTIILSVASITLSIVAIILGWVFFKASSKMQIQAESILAKISEKVEVVVESTSRQLDKTLDHLLSSFGQRSLRLPEKVEQELESNLRQKIKEETLKTLSEIGLDWEKFASPVESLTERLAKISKEQAEDFRLMDSIPTIQTKLMTLALIKQPKLKVSSVLSGSFTFLIDIVKDYFPEALHKHLYNVARFEDTKDIPRNISVGEIYGVVESIRNILVHLS